MQKRNGRLCLTYCESCAYWQTSSDKCSVAGAWRDATNSWSSSAALVALPSAHVWWPGLHRQSLSLLTLFCCLFCMSQIDAVLLKHTYIVAQWWHRSLHQQSYCASASGPVNTKMGDRWHLRPEFAVKVHLQHRLSFWLISCRGQIISAAETHLTF